MERNSRICDGQSLEMSSLPKTWIFDLDGTIVKHNGYLIDGTDTLLENSADFISRIPKDDYILIVTSRKESYREMTVDFLKKNGIRFNEILFDIPFGERILINDKKPSGLKTSISINTERDAGISTEIIINDEL